MTYIPYCATIYIGDKYAVTKESPFRRARGSPSLPGPRRGQVGRGKTGPARIQGRRPRMEPRNGLRRTRSTEVASSPQDPHHTIRNTRPSSYKGDGPFLI